MQRWQLLVHSILCPYPVDALQQLSTTASANDFTGAISLSGLSADTLYWYRLIVDGTVENPGFVQQFRSFPTTGECKFAVFADTANQDRNAVVYQRGRDVCPIQARGFCTSSRARMPRSSC